MSDEPENFTLALLRKIDAKVDGLRDEMKSDIADVRSEVKSLRADVASDLMDLETRFNARMGDHEKRLSEQFVGLRRLERHVGLPTEGH